MNRGLQAGLAGTQSWRSHAGPAADTRARESKLRPEAGTPNIWKESSSCNSRLHHALRSGPASVDPSFGLVGPG